MKTIPGLNFSTNDLPFCIQYLGKNTKGTYMFFDAQAGCVYKWNEYSLAFRRNSSVTHDGRNQLIKRLVSKDNVLSALTKSITRYRKRHTVTYR